MNSSNPLHVAVGVIKNNQGKILIALRDSSQHQGGLWEFPGGKVDENETVQQALSRELKEELDIDVQQCLPLIQIVHQYKDLSVFLDVWVVNSFSGLATGHEGQKIQWVTVDDLLGYAFPEANIAIISAIKLPSEYAILNGNELDSLLKQLQIILDNKVKLIQFRAKLLPTQEVTNFLKLAIPMCRQKSALLLINSAVKNVNNINADGIHLTATDLLAINKRPEGCRWVAASCHNKKELLHAQKIGVDFAVLAPVLETKTHPDAIPLGWKIFNQLTTEVNFPVFALGGMQKKHKQMAKNQGAQGIAGISVFLTAYSSK